MRASAVRISILGVVVFLGFISTGWSQEASSWTDQITINGFVSGSYSYNFNSPESSTNAFRVFDFDDSSFKIDVAEVVFQKAASAPGETGFRVDLTAGSSIPRVAASAGLFRDEEGQAEDFDLQQAYVSWVAPLGRGLKLDLGKHVTHAGAELIEGYDGWNNNYSRSLLFGYAIPFTHTGLKGTISFSDSVSGMFLIANGWDNVKDNNRSKSYAVGTTITPGGGISLAASYMTGAERADSNDRRDLVDLVASWQATESLSFALNYDWGQEDFGSADAEWSGLAAYLRASFGDSFAMNLRAELFDDEDGVRTGTAQKLKEVTLTPEIRLTDHALIRFDLRHDWSDEEVFDDDGEASDKQTTAAFNAIYHF